MFNPVVKVDIAVGYTDPAASYQQYNISYVDEEGYESGTGFDENEESEVFALAGSTFKIESTYMENDQVWTVNGLQISGRGTEVYFNLPDTNCGFRIERTEQTGSANVIINEITNLTGGLAGYDYTDFNFS